MISLSRLTVSVMPQYAPITYITANTDINAINLICVSFSIKMLCRKFSLPETMKDNQLLDSYPRTGVAVIVTHQKTVLFGKRTVANGGFVWQLPGGWIELGESPEQSARREVAEETGLRLGDLRLVGLTNNIFSDQSHSISLYFEAECANPEKINNMEPDKCEQWMWKNWQEVNNNLYLPLLLFKDADYRPFLTDKRGIHVSF